MLDFLTDNISQSAYRRFHLRQLQAQTLHCLEMKVLLCKICLQVILLIGLQLMDDLLELTQLVSNV